MKVFISYSGHDGAAVRSFVGDLERARVQVWLDEELGGGEAWWTAILEQIRACTVFVFALSDKSLYSRPCRAELNYAKALRLPILPVQIGEVRSYRADPIFNTQLVDYRQPSAAFTLMGALRDLEAHRAELPDPLPEPPSIPFEYLQRLGGLIHDRAAVLTPLVQMQTLIELRTALKDEDDESVRDDIRDLLRALRERTDVTYPVASEIDTILGAESPPPGKTAQKTGRKQRPVPSATPLSARLAWFRRLSRRAQVAILAGASAVVIAIGVSIGIPAIGGHQAPRTSQPEASQPPRPLDSILLSDAEINPIMGASDMATVESSPSPPSGAGTGPPGEKGTLKQSSSQLLEQSAPECMGALYPTLDKAYQGSGVEDVAWNVLEKPGGLDRAGDGNNHFVDQGVAAFPHKTDRALAFVQASANQWKGCTGKTVTVTYADNRMYTWTIGNLTGDAPTITLSYTQEGDHGYTCQRVLRAVSDIVIDVKACGDHITDEASRIANGIAARVTHAPEF